MKASPMVSPRSNGVLALIVTALFWGIGWLAMKVKPAVSDDPTRSTRKATATWGRPQQIPAAITRGQRL
jgi:hypothetical protein